ncbi:sterigmatocystin biosynthesis fatty acid synthase subunit beta [Aspergillus avenaceus]|uniref:Sterigmatocystin biosynthesis fatty acid synthase subunit beta n=1 Tax=Aspergillus avenaceus TaxID=36643 RepID=A0A5N6TFC1_ASPAV|nr:sterigmatocystin biosynthesis fatty acid synthase subunit beta [Aspergillus avenaceus]
MTLSDGMIPSSPFAISSEVTGASVSDIHGGISLTFKDVRVIFPISRLSADLDFLKTQRDVFLWSLAHPSTVNEADNEPRSPFELSLYFLRFLLRQESTPSSAFQAVTRALEHEFLQGTEIHAVVSKITESPVERRRWLQTYYQAFATAGGASTGVRSALLQEARKGEFQLVGVFGGQGTTNTSCVQELRDLYHTYRPFLAELIRTTGARLYHLSRSPETRIQFSGRFLDVDSWMRDPDTIPNALDMAEAPMSVPVTGLLGIARYAVMCHHLGLTPGEFGSILHSITGHSQGLLTATVAALSDTWESFYHYAEMAMELLFWIAFECQRATPRTSVPLDANQRPTCMLNIRGLQRAQVDSIINQINQALDPEEHVYIVVVNTRDRFVIGGPAGSLAHLDSYLTSVKANSKGQNRIPFSSRKPAFSHQFLPVSVPFHSPYLEEVSVDLKRRFSDKAIVAAQLRMCVRHTRTGRDLRELPTASVIPTLIDAMLLEVCDWPVAIDLPEATTHIIAFDPGMAPLAKFNLDGRGIRMIDASQMDAQDDEIGTMLDLFSPSLLDSSRKLQAWGQRFQPRLSTPSSGSVHLRTRLSELLGTPPVMVAGMTPTTVHWDVVSSILSAGYHAELAGGGYYKADDLSAAIMKIIQSIPPGQGVTVNLIYANPKAISWQIPLLHRLSRNQIPIHGLTIGAGVPSAEIVAEYINALGIQHISLKPGSLTAIKEVIDIAKSHPDFPIIMQWTGGRGGGHHSYEDFHAPILSMYSAIRRCSNIYLVAGSGFGNADDIYPYLTGAWSVKHGYAQMPFDGVLLGSRMMVAQEAHTSRAVKELICNTAGVPDNEWEKTYEGSAGGIITVQSEMGEPIHKIANRGVMLWAEMDKTVFSLPKKDQPAYLRRNKSYIVERLNADFAKPWFGCNSQGAAVDLEQMTYAEVLHRLVKLMYVHHQRRWVDASYVRFVRDFASRTWERLSQATGEPVSPSILEEDPDRYIIGFLEACPSASACILSPEDTSFFLMRCKQPGQKPVNFVPIFDEDFEFYFKKDSLWQSEDIDAIVDQDAGRVCVLHGPVAAKHSTQSDESARDILDGIMNGLIDRFQRGSPRVDAAQRPESGYRTPDSWSALSTATSVSESESKTSIEYSTLGQAPSTVPSAVRALLSDEFITQDRKRKDNPFRSLLDSNLDISKHFNHERSEVLIATSPDPAVSQCIKISCRNGVDIAVEVHHPSAHSGEPLVLDLRYQVNKSGLGISEVMKGRNERIKSFYSKLWFGENLRPDLTVNSIFEGRQLTLTRGLLNDLSSVTGYAFQDRNVAFSRSSTLPISVGILVAWEALVQPLVLPDIDGDLLALVHRSNKFEYCEGASPLALGDKVTSAARVKAVVIENAGKSVVVEALISRNGEGVMTVTSEFLFRGEFSDYETTFRHTKHPRLVFNVQSDVDEAILCDREWLHLADIPALVGRSLAFDLHSDVAFQDASRFKSLKVTGTTYMESDNGEWQKVGVVDFEYGACVGNPVLDFLTRKGSPLTGGQIELEKPGWSGKSTMDVQAPSDNELYGQISKDYNPIHVSTIFARLAGLPGTICHGMYTSAVAAATLDHLALDGDRRRFRRFDASFVDMVLPSEVLTVQFKHVAMCQGRMCFKVEVLRKENGEKVMEADAEIEQPGTAYLFTGQGSASPGMGMGLYESSSVAKAIWDDIDERLLNTYGWSLLDIIRNNPKSLTVHFGGKKGRAIRANYLSMSTSVALQDGSIAEQPVLPALTPKSTSYTFTDSRGLLFATMFTQPAILTVEAAAFAVLNSKGYVPENAVFSGHSLGELGALNALLKRVSTWSVIELAFYRGLIMHGAASRDDSDSSGFGMVATNPKRVGKAFTQHDLLRIVQTIAAESKDLLEIANFNVEGEQYVCTGTTTNLYVLGRTLDHLAQTPDGESLIRSMDEQKSLGFNPEISGLIAGFLRESQRLPAPIQLERGTATIPLPGVNVPFHSSHLRPTVDAYRSFLYKSGFVRSKDEVGKLIGRYVPNVVGKPFALDDSYIKHAFEITGSPVLQSLVQGKDQL